MKLANAQVLRGSPLRDAAVDIVEAGLAAIDTRSAIQTRVRIDGTDLCIDDIRFSLPDGKLLVLGAGKCSADALCAIADVLGERLTAGFAIDTVERHAPPRCIIAKGDHPYPSAQNVSHTKQLLALLSGLTQKDAVLFIISGGGTVLLAQPPEGFSADDEAALVRLLFRGGANIHELNTVRKHLSRARGGFLAAAAYPARSVALVFSDVPGNDVGFISSGPTVRDTTSVADAKNVLERFGSGTSEVVHAEASLIETPKDEKFFYEAKTVLFLSNRIALDAMAAAAKARGFEPKIVTDDLCGIAAAVGIRVAIEINAASPKTCLLWGGETTVRITGTGTGGRNREVALAALPNLSEGCLVSSVASDGIDNGPRAGAIADILTTAGARKEHLDPATYLRNNDSHAFFESAGSALITGPTGSNVADLIFALKE